MMCSLCAKYILKIEDSARLFPHLYLIERRAYTSSAFDTVSCRESERTLGRELHRNDGISEGLIPQRLITVDDRCKFEIPSVPGKAIPQLIQIGIKILLHTREMKNLDAFTEKRAIFFIPFSLYFLLSLLLYRSPLEKT